MSINESMDTMQAWTHALRLGMGYPQVAPIGNPTASPQVGAKISPARSKSPLSSSKLVKTWCWWHSTSP